MIQLAYQPAYDPFHAVFRLFRLRPIIHQFGPLHRDHVRILDFYLLFPFWIDQIRLARKDLGYKRLAAAYSHAKPYGEQPDAILVFNRMEPMQAAALETLASRSFIDRAALTAGKVQATDEPPPEKIVARVIDHNKRESDLIDFLGVLASKYELGGPNGLKARTGLLEYRYDAA